MLYRCSFRCQRKACKLYFKLVVELNKTNNATYIDNQQNNHTQNNYPNNIVVEIIPPLKD
jgi:hypothetical protein